MVLEALSVLHPTTHGRKTDKTVVLGFYVYGPGMAQVLETSPVHASYHSRSPATKVGVYDLFKLLVSDAYLGI